MFPPSYSTCIFSCCWACVGRGHPCLTVGDDLGPWDPESGCWALSLPSLTPEPAGCPETVTVSQDNCLSSGSRVVTVGNYDLFHRESTINLGGGGRNQRT